MILWIEKAIASIAPQYALKRKLAFQRIYEAAEPSKYRVPLRAPNASADSVMEMTRGRLAYQSRHLDQNNDLACGVLNSLVNKIVGSGLRDEPMTRTIDGELFAEFNQRLKRLMSEFNQHPLINESYCMAEVERLACRQWLRDGEIFCRHITGPNGAAPFKTNINYALQMFESDYLPWDDIVYSNSNPIVHGVEKDPWGAPTAYHFYKEHPGDYYPYWSMRSAETIRVPAEQVSHLKHTQNLNQTRGASIMAPVIVRLDDLGNYEQYERIAAKVAASVTLYRKKSLDYMEAMDVGLTSSSVDGGSDAAEIKLQPGLMFMDMRVGEDLGMVSSDRPNDQLTAFRESQMRAVASGTSTQYSVVSSSFDGTYVSKRQEMLEAREGYDALRMAFVMQFRKAVREQVIRAALASRQLILPRALNFSTLFDFEMYGPPPIELDPLKETEADLNRLSGRFRSRHQIIRHRGGDAVITDSEIVADPFADEIYSDKTPNMPSRSESEGEDSDEPEDQDEDQDEAA